MPHRDRENPPSESENVVQLAPEGSVSDLYARDRTASPSRVPGRQSAATEPLQERATRAPEALDSLPPGCAAYLPFLASPDDGRPLRLVAHAGQWALFSTTADALYPIIDGIPILLGEPDRSYELEGEVIRAFLSASEAPVRLAATKTMALLESRKGLRSFAWEDEEHWTAEYSKAASETLDDTKWKDRIWQRQPAVDAAAIQDVKVVLDIGCGEGQNSRSLLVEPLPEDCLYIGVDISLAGLRLNRSRCPWKRALFVVCSADRLPFAEQTVDLICYFGILHHIEQKAEGLPAHLKRLRPEGRVILHEAVDRPRILSDRFRQHESAHEERFDVRDLERIIEKDPAIEVRYWEMRHSIFWSFWVRAFGPKAMLRRRSYAALHWVDALCIRILGPLLPWFRGGEVLGALRYAPRDQSQ